MDHADVLAAFESDCETASLISFDLFDTLLFRTVRSPHDVFRLLGVELVRQGIAEGKAFADTRIAAEQKARSVAAAAGRCEVTLADIYAQMPGPYVEALSRAGVSKDDLVEREIALEIACAQPNREVVDIFRRLGARGHKLVIVSDMYLPHAVIVAMARRIGIEIDEDDVTVSCEIQGTKAEGSIWPLIRAKYGLSDADAIVHLGDNAASDGTRAREKGIVAHVIAPVERRVPIGRLAGRPHWFLGACEALLRAEIAADPSLTEEQVYWREVAYLVVLPVCVGMSMKLRALWERDRSRPIFFLARDGLIFKKAYEAIYDDAPSVTRYVWSSRRCTNFPSIESVDDYALKLMLSLPDASEPPNAILRRFGLDPSDPGVAAKIARHFEDGEAPVAEDRDGRLRALLVDLEPEIVDRAAGEFATVSRHFRETGLADGRGIIVDLGWYGSMMNALVRLLRRMGVGETDLSALLLGTFSSFPSEVDGVAIDGHGWLLDRGRYTSKTPLGYALNLNILELMFGAPARGTLYLEEVDGAVRPVANEDRSDERRMAIAAIIHDAVERGAAALREQVRLLDPEEIRTLAMEGILAFQLRPNAKDVKMFGQVLHAEGIGASKSRPMIPPPYLGLSLHRMMRNIRDGYWSHAYVQSLPLWSRGLHYAAFAIDKATKGQWLDK